jgi:hypothetical protein
MELFPIGVWPVPTETRAVALTGLVSKMSVRSRLAIFQKTIKSSRDILGKVAPRCDQRIHHF